MLPLTDLLTLVAALTIDKDNSLFLTYFSNVITLLQAAHKLVHTSLQEFPLLPFPIYTEVGMDSSSHYLTTQEIASQQSHTML